MEIEINPSDIIISDYTEPHVGSWNFDRINIGVSIYHKPSGITVKSHSEISQHKNRNKAIEVLKQILSSNATGANNMSDIGDLVKAEMINEALSTGIVAQSLALLINLCHGDNKKAGWWDNLKTGEYMGFHFDSIRVEGLSDQQVMIVSQKLLLIHSEISEATEGFRKNLNDDKLTEYSQLEVELYDALIRILDLMGALGMKPDSFVKKIMFNRERSDHKVENRKKSGGKLF